MKRSLFVLVCIICLAAILFGKMHWNHKLKTTAAQANAQLDETQAMLSRSASESTISADSSEKTADDTRGDQAAANAYQRLDLTVSEMTVDLPKVLAETITSAIQQDETIQLVTVNMREEAQWPALLQTYLDHRYGPGVFNVLVRTYGDYTTYQLLHSNRYVASFNIPAQADIVLFESLILNDQKLVPTEDTLKGTRKLAAAIKDHWPQAVFLLQPPNPLYQHEYYTDHVQTLKAFAQEKNILYVNHWEAWPTPESEAILSLLSADHVTPNDKGYERWAQFLADYFTSQ